MKIILLTLSILIALAVPALSQDRKKNGFTVKDYTPQEPKVNENNIYRSNINHYRIKIPKGWIINRPNSIGVEFNATDSLKVATMNIHVTHFDKPIQKSVYDFPVDQAVTLLREGMPNTELIEGKKTYINNVESLLVKTRSNIKSLEYDYHIITRQYILLRGSKMVSITFQVIQDLDEVYAPAFEDTLLSFIFEESLYKD
ncbi:hypothetical protein [Pontibacter populi]|uniref:DUF1795 domain-containing protein n=1 Tax=Pontibacter populi TaxID=890055 RepID=A0ABV1RP40_9BACT